MEHSFNETILAERFPELWKYVSPENVTDVGIYNR